VTTDVILPKEYALVLLRKLADDDAFRHLYEANPVNALRAIGVPADVLASLPPAHQTPIKLAPKNTFQEALYQLIDEVAGVCICHTPPQIRLSIGTSTRASGAGGTPFTTS
jgi:putative modified peptide